MTEKRGEPFEVRVDTGSVWTPGVMLPVPDGRYLCIPLLEGERLDQVRFGTYYPAASTKPSPICGRMRPSIHMPKRFARLWVRVTDVRVERVQDITYGDVLAEGVAASNEGRGAADKAINTIADFHALWDSINAKRGYGWDVNPWTWAVTFEVTDRTGEEV